MKARIVITEDGKVSYFADEGNFEEGKKFIEEELRALQAQGVQIDVTAPVEQHRHDLEHEHEHQKEANHA